MAQWLARLTRNQSVMGSNPIKGSRARNFTFITISEYGPWFVPETDSRFQLTTRPEREETH